MVRTTSIAALQRWLKERMGCQRLHDLTCPHSQFQNSTKPCSCGFLDALEEAGFEVV